MDAVRFDGAVVFHFSLTALENHRGALVAQDGLEGIVGHVQARGDQLCDVHRGPGAENNPGGINDKNPAISIENAVEHGWNVPGAYSVEHRRSAVFDGTQILVECNRLGCTRIKIAPVDNRAMLGVDDRMIPPLKRHGSGSTDHIRHLESQDSRQRRVQNHTAHQKIDNTFPKATFFENFS